MADEVACLGEWKTAYPQAKVYACEEVVGKINDPAFEFTGGARLVTPLWFSLNFCRKWL